MDPVTPQALTIEEKRDLLEVVRIKFGVEARVPRELAIDRICEKALLGSSPSSPLAVSDVCGRLQDRKAPLRFNEVRNAIGRLRQRGRVLLAADTRPQKYFLGDEAAAELAREIGEANARIQRIVAGLYAGVAIDPRKLRGFLLRVLCELFARFGKEWVRIAVGRVEMKDIFDPTDVRRILVEAAKWAAIEKSDRNLLFARTLQFFRDDEPDYRLLKFTLGQSYFIAQLLAMDIPFDPLSTEIFSGSVFYLDTNAVIGALLPGAARFRAFQELVGICRRLGATLVVARPTLDETRSVVAYEQTEVSKVYDQVPPHLVERTYGDFFQTYVAGKRDNSAFRVDEVFRPFEHLSKTLSDQYGIEIVDDTLFERLRESKDIEKVKQVVFRKSRDVRRKRKGDGATEHDAVLYLFVQSQRVTNSKTRLITLDRSLPAVGLELSPGELSFALTLDGFLQSLSPFVSIENELDFATVFSRLIDKQVFPQDLLYDIRDYLVFEDIGLSCRQIPQEDLDEALYILKTKVLRGDHYTREDFNQASYEFRRLFTCRYLQREELLATKEAEIQRVRDAHSREKRELADEAERRLREKEERLQQEIDGLRRSSEALQGQVEKDRLQRMRRVKLAKRVLVGAVFFGGMASTIWLSLQFGEGTNPWQKVKDFWQYHLGVVALTQLVVSLLLPEDDILRRLLQKN
jgi:hypothetical protein